MAKNIAETSKKILNLKIKIIDKFGFKKIFLLDAFF